MSPVLRRTVSSWRVKLAAQRAIAALPGGLGTRVYHLLQTVSGLDPNVRRHVEYVDRIERIMAELGRGPLRGSTVAELGSGWFPVMPLILFCRGARAIHTYDLSDHYSVSRTRQAARELSRHVPHCPSLRGTAETGILPETVRYHPRTDMSEHPIASGSVDLAVSAFVLEHVPPGEIEKLHRASLEWLADDGIWIHWVSPSDHRAFSDPRLGPLDFLRYGEAEWARIAGNRFAYHNRLRRPQYRDLFERSGWRVVYDDAVVRDDLITQLPSMVVHPDFAAFAPADLVAGSLVFALEKGVT